MRILRTKCHSEREAYIKGYKDGAEQALDDSLEDGVKSVIEKEAGNGKAIKEMMDKVEEIYSEIPSQIIATKIEELSGGEIKEKDVTGCFGGGEFPIVKIYKLDPKSNGEGRNEIHATYDIMR